MKGHGEKLSRKKEQAIAALLTKPTIPAAAQEVGVTPVTLWRWLQIDEFQEAYRKARRDAVAQATAHLQKACGEAVLALRVVMRDDNAPASARVSAARAVLELAIRGIEVEDLEQRIIALEEHAGGENC